MPHGLVVQGTRNGCRSAGKGLSECGTPRSLRESEDPVGNTSASFVSLWLQEGASFPGDLFLPAFCTPLRTADVTPSLPSQHGASHSGLGASALQPLGEPLLGAGSPSTAGVFWVSAFAFPIALTLCPVHQGHWLPQHLSRTHSRPWLSQQLRPGQWGRSEFEGLGPRRRPWEPWSAGCLHPPWGPEDPQTHSHTSRCVFCGRHFPRSGAGPALRLHRRGWALLPDSTPGVRLLPRDGENLQKLPGATHKPLPGGALATLTAPVWATHCY